MSLPRRAWQARSLPGCLISNNRFQRLVNEADTTTLRIRVGWSKMTFFQTLRFAAPALALGVLLIPTAGAAEPNGREVYRAECARCHGKNGEGVAKKYKDGLYGDWSVE